MQTAVEERELREREQRRQQRRIQQDEVQRLAGTLASLSARRDGLRKRLAEVRALPNLVPVERRIMLDQAQSALLAVVSDLTATSARLKTVSRELDL